MGITLTARPDRTYADVGYSYIFDRSSPGNRLRFPSSVQLPAKRTSGIANCILRRYNAGTKAKPIDNKCTLGKANPIHRHDHSAQSPILHLKNRAQPCPRYLRSLPPSRNRPSQPPKLPPQPAPLLHSRRLLRLCAAATTRSSSSSRFPERGEPPAWPSLRVLLAPHAPRVGRRRPAPNPQIAHPSHQAAAVVHVGGAADAVQPPRAVLHRPELLEELPPPDDALFPAF